VPSPIIARADALMHRRRQNDQELDDIPVLTDYIDDSDDIPVLTEVESVSEHEAAMAIIETALESVEPFAPVAPPEILQAATPEHPVIDPALREQLVHELGQRIEERIKAALPEIISSTVRDFLADQDMIANR
jgi:hypothetical protein